jgi:hypothetical protein
LEGLLDYRAVLADDNRPFKDLSCKDGGNGNVEDSVLSRIIAIGGKEARNHGERCQTGFRKLMASKSDGWQMLG